MQYYCEATNKMLLKMLVLCCCTGLSCVLINVCPIALMAEVLSNDSLSQTCVIDNKAAAFDRAIAYLGFKELPDFSEKNLQDASLSLIENCRTPFVTNRMENNKVWKLFFIDVPLVGHFGKVKRDFQIILDPTTGQLLSVYSLSDKLGSPDTLPEPDALVAEKDLEKRLILFDGLPKEIPQTTLIKAFEQCTITPQTAKVIRAFYINYHTRTIEHNDTWMIILRGTEIPMEAAGRWGSVPVNERNSLLYSVDSETGLLEFLINAPQDIDMIRRMKGIIK